MFKIEPMKSEVPFAVYCVVYAKCEGDTPFAVAAFGGYSDALRFTDVMDDGYEYEIKHTAR